MPSSYLNHQQQHMLWTISSGLCAAVLMFALLGLTSFVMFKGSYFFWPMQTLVLSTNVPDTIGEDSLSYQLTPQSKEEVLATIQARLAAQYRGAAQVMPEVRVTPADDVYQINLHSGEIRLGRFSYAQGPAQKPLPITEYESLAMDVGALVTQLEQIQLESLSPLHKRISQLNVKHVDHNAPARQELQEKFVFWQTKAQNLQRNIAQYKVYFWDAQGREFDLDIENVEHFFQPNTMSSLDKLEYAAGRIWQFVSQSPKQAATNGGVFPALFGTVLMVIIMAVLVTPFGALAAIYLHEYARDNKFTAVIRICVSNMAGVPSVVYGVFGLGFFVYTLGGSIDALLYADKLPTPTFGSPGLFWAALTMALLTLPVVIVSTEEGLRRVPRGLRSGCYALGATKFETIVKTVLPIASPGIMTGVILAIARASGEVAPLILVGAVKFAPTLPVDGNFPFVHLERQFMHLGAFIYDGAFYNQTNTSGSSMMFASCLLLLAIVCILNLFAIIMRSKLRKRYVRA